MEERSLYFHCKDTAAYFLVPIADKYIIIYALGRGVYYSKRLYTLPTKSPPNPQKQPKNPKKVKKSLKSKKKNKPNGQNHTKKKKIIQKLNVPKISCAFSEVPRPSRQVWLMPTWMKFMRSIKFIWTTYNRVQKSTTHIVASKKITSK